jgi:hypothetical protein
VTLSDDLSSRAVGVGGTSVATIFLVAVVYGWAAAAVAAFLAMALVEVARRRPISRIALNCGIYVLAAIAAGGAAALATDPRTLRLFSSGPRVRDARAVRAPRLAGGDSRRALGPVTVRTTKAVGGTGLGLYICRVVS